MLRRAVSSPLSVVVLSGLLRPPSLLWRPFRPRRSRDCSASCARFAGKPLQLGTVIASPNAIIVRLLPEPFYFST